MPPTRTGTVKKVALLIESSRSYGRRLLRGISLYSRTRGSWSLLHQEMTMGDSVPDWILRADVSGVIARVDTHNIGPLKKLGLPIVDVLCSRSNLGIPQVETDDHAVARLAFDHLYERGFRRFAYCGYRGAHYSQARLHHFRSCVEEHGCPLTVYETEGDRGKSLSEAELPGVLDSDPLTQWLLTLQRPTGLMACHDIRGQQVLNVCRQLSIAIPDDIGVIGVDDDDTVCPLSDPTLTSVRPDADAVGYCAAETLDAMMTHGASPPSVQHVSPIEVVQRHSTQVFAVEDPELSRVCRFIRENACHGIDVAALVRFSNLSRRQLERRFRKHLGRTPREEINAVQIRRLKQLLDETELPLEQIAPLAGYNHTESMSVTFKRETGQTPGAYRRQQRLPKPRAEMLRESNRE
ncbi:Xylose operon regulatory protein [Stieleria maiorica]|uniref:Xylose operon regulatory protein n=1 Tax=Stieleria maiorica TaxID=2795974 RepID=A0A5B9MC05_9BACT|nr:DNA-binding transcriptional regulator [Stieleria maiorica]QEF98303.1 Xylose operon regulatory protein [Stieleria maiorica]